MSTAAMAGQEPWYRSLDANQWKTMIASNIGWMFDGYEAFALILTVGVALHQLLAPAQYPQIPAFAGTVIGITLLGWGVGGFIGGVIADYIGRRRTMILAILAYSLTTGLSAIAWDSTEIRRQEGVRIDGVCSANLCARLAGAPRRFVRRQSRDRRTAAGF